jgi:probable F420-dependent oxidoreductase
MTYLLVLPYRNPLLAARSIATTDRLSSGRLDLVVGPGYLRSEFAALGVDFDRRGELLDQAIDVLRQVFTTKQLRYEGSSFTALGVAIEPGPIQLPHPPIWIGGNGARSRERAALVGNGWSPLQVDAAKSATTRSVTMFSIDHIRSAIEDLYRRVDDAGRERADVPVQLQSSTLAHINDGSVERIREHVAELESVGVRQMAVKAPDTNVDGVIAALETFGEEVVLNQR